MPSVSSKMSFFKRMRILLQGRHPLSSSRDMGIVLHRQLPLFPEQLSLASEKRYKFQIKQCVSETLAYSTSQIALKFSFETVASPSLQIFYQSVSFKPLTEDCKVCSSNGEYISNVFIFSLLRVLTAFFTFLWP